MTDYQPPPVRDNEAIYDEQINPLMAQIIAICKEHGIPMLASFVYAPDSFCTTAIPGPDDDEASQRLERARELIKPPVHFAAFTVTVAKAVP
jgi:hypothetical protein